MPKFYKARNKRMIARASNGKFRPTTLADLGVGTCRECGAFFAPHLELAQSERGFIDPVQMNRLKYICPTCGDYEPRPEPKHEGLSSLADMIGEMAKKSD